MLEARLEARIFLAGSARLEARVFRILKSSARLEARSIWFELIDRLLRGVWHHVSPCVWRNYGNTSLFQFCFMLWSSNNLIITIITLCTIIHEMKTRCGRDEINMWEWIQLEDNLPDDLKKINHSFLARFPILVLIRGLRTLPVRLPVLLGPPG